MEESNMSQTIVQKILAKNSGKKTVEPGEVVYCKIDKVLVKEYTHGYYAYEVLNEIGAGCKIDPKDILLADGGSFVPDVTRGLHAWAKEIGIPKENIYRYYGIFHYAALDHGYILPGTIYTCTDSHTPIGGALGAFGIGLGGTDVGVAMATGELWLEVPQTLKVVLNGELKNLVTMKDVMLKIAAERGLSWGLGRVVEWAGPVVRKTNIDERYTISTFSVDVASPLSMVIEPDDTTLEYLKGRAKGPMNPIKNDPDAVYDEIIEEDVSNIEPMVSTPHNQGNGKPARELSNIKVDQVVIGTCTNGRMTDLRIGAQFLEGKHIHKDVRLTVSPTSMEVYRQAEKEGLLGIYTEAGAVVANPTCLICNGRTCSMPANGEVVLTTSNRNHRGRLGNPDADIYLCAPATAAVSAITGKITDPRDF
jgi:3-isopropylmalate/(R)-2-methylmalate dehydratase large subunit